LLADGRWSWKKPVLHSIFCTLKIAGHSQRRVEQLSAVTVEQNLGGPVSPF
jgi:hypothetical protein